MYLVKINLYIHTNKYTNQTCKCKIFIVHEDKYFYARSYSAFAYNDESYRTCVCCGHTIWVYKNNYEHKGKIKDSEKAAKFLLEMLK